MIKTITKYFWSILLGFSIKAVDTTMMDKLATLQPICRKHYGDDPECPPDIPDDQYYWDDNGYSHTYGWNESDKPLRERIKNYFKIN